MTTEHGLELKELDLHFQGVKCGSKLADFSARAVVRVDGLDGVVTSIVSTYDAQPAGGYNVVDGGNDRASTRDVKLVVSDVKYPTTRDSLEVTLALDAVRDLPRLSLGTVKLTLPGLPEGCTMAVDTSSSDNDVRSKLPNEQTTKLMRFVKLICF